jgi:hypothetical protein
MGVYDMFGKKKASEAPAPATVSAPAAPAPASTEISPEIIAVITAAIAAMTGSGAVSSNGLIIRKISRIHGEKVSWSNAGLMECIDSRRI